MTHKYIITSWTQYPAACNAQKEQARAGYPALAVGGGSFFLKIISLDFRFKRDLITCEELSQKSKGVGVV